VSRQNLPALRLRSEVRGQRVAGGRRGSGGRFLKVFSKDVLQELTEATECGGGHFPLIAVGYVTGS
jgi:hypothetical protein